MNVTEFRGALALAENYEIVESPLPKMTVAAPPIAMFDRWGHPEHSLRKRFLQRLHDNRRILSFRLSDQQVHMFRHHDVTDHDKSKTPPNFFEHFQKQIACPWTAQQRFSLIATGGDEMQISGAVITVKTSWHTWVIPKSACISL